MSSKIQFFYNPMSRARMAHWGLEEIGEPYEISFVDFKKANPELLAANPMGKVPTIVHRGVPIYETAAILTYLGDFFPAKKLAPTLEDPRRGEYLRWMFFLATNFEAAVLENKFPRVQSIPASSLGFGSYELVMGVVEKALHQGHYLLGEWFTMADVFLAAQLEWSMYTKTVEPRPVFTQYVQRCTSRAAHQRAKGAADKMIKEIHG